jgi:hypothetical protein
LRLKSRPQKQRTLEATLKQLSTGALTAIFAVAFGLTTIAATAVPSNAQGNIGPYAQHSSTTTQLVAQADTAPPADFGVPPSGEVPILFNDHHVYSKPDKLKQNRVLAALVRGSTKSSFPCARCSSRWARRFRTIPLPRPPTFRSPAPTSK